MYSLHDSAHGLKMGERTVAPKTRLPVFDEPCTIFDMCYACGGVLAYGYKPGFNDVCDICGKDIHVCRMCRFYAPGAHWDCAENVEEHVIDKEKRNHCEFFVLAEKYVDGGPSRESRSASDAKRKFSALFGE